MGNREAKELIYMTHEHELRGVNAGGRWGAGWRGIKGRKKWDNCNNIINKIYLKIVSRDKGDHCIMIKYGQFNRKI